MGIKVSETKGATKISSSNRQYLPDCYSIILEDRHAFVEPVALFSRRWRHWLVL
jgi:hypothetical protein